MGPQFLPPRPLPPPARATQLPPAIRLYQYGLSAKPNKPHPTKRRRGKEFDRRACERQQRRHASENLSSLEFEPDGPSFTLQPNESAPPCVRAPLQLQFRDPEAERW